MNLNLETVRRAVGRFFAKAAVREAGRNGVIAPAKISTSPLRAGPIQPGALEEEVNSPKIDIQLAGPPRAVIAGGSAASGSLFDCRIGADMTKFSAKIEARVGGALVFSAARAPSGAYWVSPGAGGASLTRVPLLPRRLQVAGVPVLRANRAGRPRKADKAGSAFVAVPKPRVCRVPPALLERIPIERESVPIPQTGSLEARAAYLNERQMLAKAAGEGIDFTQIELIGIYPKVPVSTARRLEVERGTGSLLVYLRPNAIFADGPKARPIVRVAIGRVAGEGRLVRAIIRE